MRVAGWMGVHTQYLFRIGEFSTNFIRAANRRVDRVSQVWSGQYESRKGSPRGGKREKREECHVNKEEARERFFMVSERGYEGDVEGGRDR